MNKIVKGVLIAGAIYFAYQLFIKKPQTSGNVDNTHLDKPTLITKILELGHYDINALQAKTDQELLDLYNAIRPGK